MAKMLNRRFITFLSIIVWISNCWAEDGFRICFQETEGSSRVRDPNTHAADGVPILPGLSHFEMTPTIEVAAVTTSGKSRHIKTSSQTSSIVSAFKRRKEARNVKELEALAPVGAKAHLGHNISAMTPTTGGGCRYAWKIESKSAPSYTISACRVCFKETEGSSQCQGNRQSCSGWSAKESPKWTLPFRDDTDNRGGGCAYYWYLDCQNSKCGAALNCPRE